MKLLYVWIENYKNIKRQGFHFSNEYEFTFTPKIDLQENPKTEELEKRVVGGTLICENNDQYIPDFFGKNIDITAIVGRNGTGKSTIIHSILDLLRKEGKGIPIDSNNHSQFWVPNNIICIYKLEKRSIRLFSTIIDFKDIINKTEQPIQEDDGKTSLTSKKQKELENIKKRSKLPIPKEIRLSQFCSLKYKFHEKTNYIYYSDSLTPSIFYTNNIISRCSGELKNIAMEGVIYKLLEDSPNKHLFSQLYLDNIKHEVKFLQNNNFLKVLKNSLKHFNFPTTLIFRINPEIEEKLARRLNIPYIDNISKSLDSAISKDDSHFQNMSLIKWINNIVKSTINLTQLNDSKRAQSLLVFDLYFILNQINSFLEMIQLLNQDDFYNYIINELEETGDVNYRLNKPLEYTLNIIKNFKIKHESEIINENFNHLIFYQNFKQQLKDLDYKLNLNSDSSLQKHFFIYDLIFDLTKLEDIQTLLQNYHSSLKYAEYIDFIWGHPLSNGEQNILTLLSRLYDLFDDSSSNKINKAQDILLLVDEGEVNLHPDWQKRFINILIHFFNTIKNCNLFNNRIQIILTSHSPFILSDIPKQNVIFLNKNDDNTCKVVSGISQKNTFGANIHTLLSDAFFMEEGTMGEFAKGKINDIIKVLNFLILRQEDPNNYKQRLNYLIQKDFVQFQKILDYLNQENTEIQVKIISDLKKMYPDKYLIYIRENIASDLSLFPKIEKIINTIGEPFLKSKLQEMYFRAFGEDKNSKKDLLLKKKKEIEKQLKELDND